MKKIFKKLTVFCLCILMLACSTVPYDAHKKIEPQGNFYTRTLSQDGKMVSRFDVMSALKLKPATAELAAKSQNWTYAAYGLSLLGGFLIGINLAQNNGSSNLFMGALAVGAGAGAAYYSDQPLLDAVQTHNTGSRKKHGALDFDFNFKFARIETPSKSDAIPVLGLRAEF